MVMAGREGVDRASALVTAVALIGLGEQMINALVKVPFSRPWSGASDPIRNTGASVSRAVLRSFLGFSTSLPIDEFRSVEAVLDQVCETVSAPVVWARHIRRTRGELGGVGGDWYRPPTDPGRNDPLLPWRRVRRHLPGDVRVSGPR